MPKSTRNISKETITTLSDAPTPPPGKILQIRSGKVKTLVAEPSGIFKQVQPGRVFVNEHGIGNDEHVYPIHWSPDRALHQYASEHYASWRCEDACPKPELFDYGAFGENIVGTNMNEENVCVGDVYRIGKDVVVEVSEPRSPCYKLNLRFEWGRALKRVSRTARTGWNMRVKTAGYICAGDVIQLVERPHPRWSILNIKRVIQGKNVALHLVAELCNLEVVTSMVRDFAQNRLQSTPKRYEVVDIRPVTSRIKQFTFQLQETFTINEPAFREFTFAQIEFGTGDEKYSRSYSIVSGDLNRFSLGVAHDDHSRGGSRYLHTKLKVGDMITMAPGGVPKAVEDEQKCIKDGLVERRLVIIGGIGVTAFLPKISEWEKKDIDYEVHYATRSRDEAAFLDRFPDEKITLYAKIEGKRLDLNTLIPGPDKDGKHTTRIYCCGPEGLMNAAQRRAEDLGYPDHMLHFESFGADSAGTKDRKHASGSLYGLHGSFTAAPSINELKKLSTNPELEILNPDLKLSYGNHDGKDKLRDSIAALHSSGDKKLTRDNVIITPGSIMANYMLLETICGPGDHVVCQYPTYGQLYLIPKLNGVDVSLWKMNDGNAWLPRIEELEQMIKPNTKAIILNNPNNPTGAVLKKETLLRVIEIAKKTNITVFSDEVFSPLFFTDAKPPSIVSLGYANTVATGSLSKAFALPGIRLGWIITENAELVKAINMKRAYTTIAVSQIDGGIASFALDPAVTPALMERNIQLCREGLDLIEGLVKRNPDRVKWVKPEGAGTAFIQVLDGKGAPVDDVDFCTKLAETESVCLIPGGFCFGEGGEGDFKGYMRIILGDPELLRQGLPAMERFIRSYP
ncbi:hypothetical protein K4K60_001148 [Colletotrichum sp. SAR11_57]|nr:hypothetical protein K4K60_001148 [Colletotrichum sp. SAR11_57]